jgi:hypothetical protein
MNSSRRTSIPQFACLGFALLGALSATSWATWSIVVVDTSTHEVGVAAATCLSNFDLQAGLPMILVDVGAAAAQSQVDTGAANRIRIRNEMLASTPPNRILTVISQADPAYQNRQFGIIDARGRAVTFTGTGANPYDSGMTGQTGNLIYSIQGNVLTGAPVLTQAQNALVNTPGDIPEKLMAAMEAAAEMGGDGRCSCLPNNPTSCGSPPDSFEKSAHIGFIVLARSGDIDGTCTGPAGCANGNYFLSLNVPFQAVDALDPVLQLREAFDAWRSGDVGRPDAVQSEVTIDPPSFRADTGGQATMTIHLHDWQGTPLAQGVALNVQHDPQSTGLSTIGDVKITGPGTYAVELNVPPSPGLDIFRVTAVDFVRPVILLPSPALPVYALTDTNLDNDVDQLDAKLVLGCIGGPGSKVAAQCQDRDTDGDADVDLKDARHLQLEFTDAPCDTLYLVSSPQSELIACGYPFTFNVIVDAVPAAHFQWYRNGEPIPGAITATYHVPVATASDEGEYYIEIVNPCGTIITPSFLLTPRNKCP